MIKHSEAREMYESAIEDDEDNRREALEDLRFRAGFQWPEDVERDRQAAQRPVLRINRMGQFVRQITGEARQNPPSIAVRPVDEGDEDFAELREGLIRHIEHRSKAQDAYITALDGSATCGMGNIRILTEFSEHDPVNQEIRISAIRDHLSVVYDPDARRITKEDGRFAFVTGIMSDRKFERVYPKAKKVGFDRVDGKIKNPQFWQAKDGVRVAEMFRREEFERTALILENGEVIFVPVEGLDAKAKKHVADVGLEREHKFKDFRVKRSVLHGDDYLEDEVEFPSKYIPLIPVVGEEVCIGEAMYRHGVVRFARDPQRLYNYWRTAAAEMIALAPRAPFMATAAQVGPYKAQWDNANRTTSPYLLYQHDSDEPGPPKRATAPEPPAAMWQEASIASDDMKSVTGIYDAALGAQSNETSGKAILARQREGDIGTFVYIDNLRHAVERVGFTLLDMIPRIYDAERQVRLVGEDNTTKPIKINQTLPDGTVLNDMSKGNFDVRVSTGPSYTTKRVETAEMLMELTRSVPKIGEIGADILVDNLDIAGADKLAARLRKTMPPELLEDEDGEPIPTAPPPPPNPADVAQAEKDSAAAEKLNAETEQIRIENIARMTGANPQS